MSSEKLSLDGRVAVVTGGGTGLGRAMCLALAEAGAHIVASARRIPPIEETAELVRAKGRRALAIATDVTDSRQAQALVERTLAEWGRIDILINNAGIVRGEVLKPIWEVTDAEWRVGIDTNLSGAFYCSRAVAPHMVAQRRGKIINVASGWGFRGQRNNFMYCCAKGGVIQFTKSLALSLASDNIQVNGIAPGWFFSRPVLTAGDQQEKETRGRFIPLGRVGEPEEIGPLAVFLASDASSYIAGETFAIDGGGLVAGYAPTGWAPLIDLPL